jgi:hypothetical protein
MVTGFVFHLHGKGAGGCGRGRRWRCGSVPPENDDDEASHSLSKALRRNATEVDACSPAEIRVADKCPCCRRRVRVAGWLACSSRPRLHARRGKASSTERRAPFHLVHVRGGEQAGQDAVCRRGERKEQREGQRAKCCLGPRASSCRRCWANWLFSSFLRAVTYFICLGYGGTSLWCLGPRSAVFHR